MRKIHEVLRLHFEHGGSKREIARIINVSPSTVSDYVARAKLAGLSSPLPPGCDDAALERLLFPSSEPSSVQRPAPAWPAVHNELRRKGVTLELLWQEYKVEQAELSIRRLLRALPPQVPATEAIDAAHPRG